MRHLNQLQFQNTYADLPDAFHRKLSPTPLQNAFLIDINKRVAALIGLDLAATGEHEIVTMLSGQTPLPGADPLAAIYAGHQFGVYVPQLGDGRAILLGEVVNNNGERWDIQLKGGGLTPFSRQGDGRAVLRSTIREYLCSEAMHGLGIPTTRALCIIGSETPVYREQVEPGALLVRIAQTHVRFGSFELFFYRNQHEELKILADYLIEHHYPELEALPDKYQKLLETIVIRTARLIAQWQAVGFNHGVMNTDNMSAIGLTLDYGPFGFLDTYDPDFVCNHSDYQGRYAFNQQPNIGLWNVTALAQALTALISVDDAKAALEKYEPAFVTRYVDLMRDKLGLKESSQEVLALTNELLAIMAQNRIDYTFFFRHLCDFKQGARNGKLRDQFIDRAAFDAWAQKYSAKLQEENSDDATRSIAMKKANPKFVLRNHLAQIAIEKAHQGDFSEIKTLIKILEKPFDEWPEHESYAGLPPEWAQQIVVSCSS